MTAAAADIGDCFKAGKIVGPQDAGNLSRRFSHHRLVEQTGGLRIFAEVPPKTAWYDFLLNGLSGGQGIGEVLKSTPVHGQTDHADKRSHRLRMVRSQETRCRRMTPHAITSFKDAFSRKNAQRARQRSRMCSGVPREF